MSESNKKQNNPTPVIKSNSLYDALKQFAQIHLPAIGTLYFALSQIWGLPAGAEVVGTITAVDTFLGVLLHISNVQYNNSDAKYDGIMDIHETPDKKTFAMNLHSDPDDLEDKQEIIFKVKKH